jgi:hypothetical protein
VKRVRHIITSFSYPPEKEEVFYEAGVLAARERKSLSEFIVGLVEAHVKAHASGNPNYELDKWQDNPEFLVVPALLEANEKWDKYLDSCDEKELARIQGCSQVITKKAKDQTFKKKFKKNV